MKQDPFPVDVVRVITPDLGAADEPIRFVTWLVPGFAPVIPGERIAELMTQGTVFQLEALAEGVLCDLTAQPGAIIRPGDLLASIRPLNDAEN